MGKKRILVADGDREVAGSICEYLKPDYRVVYVDDGREILPLIQNKQVDLLLVDLDVPHVFVYHVLSEIRQNHPRVKIAVMYVYCDYTQEMEQNIRKLSDVVFLKPFNMEEVKRRLDGLLQ